MDKKDERSKAFNPALAAPYGEGSQVSQEDIYKAFGAGPKTLQMLQPGEGKVPQIDNKLKFEPGKIGSAQGVESSKVTLALPNGVNMSMDDVLAAIEENARLRKAVEANHEWHKVHDDYDGYPESELCEQNSAALTRRPTREVTTVEGASVYGERMVRFCPSCGCVGEVSGSYLNCCPDASDARRVPESVVNSLREMFVRSLGSTSPDLDVRTRILVRDFSKAMAGRFMEAQTKRGAGREVDWMRDDWAADCYERLQAALHHQKMADVANYAAIIWFHTTRLEGE